MPKRDSRPLNVYVRRQPNNPGFMSRLKHAFTGDWDDDPPWMYDPKYAIHPDSKVGQNYIKHRRRERMKAAVLGEQFGNVNAPHGSARNNGHHSAAAENWHGEMPQVGEMPQWATMQGPGGNQTAHGTGRAAEGPPGTMQGFATHRGQPEAQGGW
jgi:hypothetical protein